AARPPDLHFFSQVFLLFRKHRLRIRLKKTPRDLHAAHHLVLPARLLLKRKKDFAELIAQLKSTLRVKEENAFGQRFDQKRQELALKTELFRVGFGFLPERHQPPQGLDDGSEFAKRIRRLI